MEGQYLGEVKGSDGSPLGTLLTLLDPGLRHGSAIYTSEDARRYVLALKVLDSKDKQTHLELTASKPLETIYHLETPVPENVRVTLSVTEAEEYRREGTFTLEGLEQAVTGTVDLFRLWSPATPPDKTFDSWEECKHWMDSHRAEGPSLYRGQSKPLPLATSFHRTGRVDLVRWLHDDMPKFADYATTVLDRTFDWNNLTDRGALVGLAQHHGFPSPMLDWSRSPYISAFFAFSGVVEAPKSEDPVRIFRLRPRFLADFPVHPETLTAITPLMKIELFRPAAMGNTRLLSQQGMMLFTNVASPEQFIRILESRNKQSYLEVVDVRGSVCKDALADLRRMGITAASLFPGLDGIGLALKHELFYSP